VFQLKNQKLKILDSSPYSEPQSISVSTTKGWELDVGLSGSGSVPYIVPTLTGKFINQTQTQQTISDWTSTCYIGNTYTKWELQLSKVPEYFPLASRHGFSKQFSVTVDVAKTESFSAELQCTFGGYVNTNTDDPDKHKRPTGKLPTEKHGWEEFTEAHTIPLPFTSVTKPHMQNSFISLYTTDLQHDKQEQKEQLEK